MFQRLSLLWKIWLSTSVALSLILVLSGIFLQRHSFETTSRSMEEAVQAGFHAYESVWNTRAELLSTVAAVLASMDSVRAAFGTGDVVAIRDSAAHVWKAISGDLRERAFFLVTTPEGEPIASLDAASPSALPRGWRAVLDARDRFPKQVSGVVVAGEELYHTVLTPVYRDTENGRVLTNVLVAGYPINHLMARRLKDETGGSEFLFLSPERVYASTLNTRATEALAKALAEDPEKTRISDGITEYAVIGRDLMGPHGEAVAKLYIFRSYTDALEHIYRLRRDLILVWLLAMSAGLAVSYWVVRWVIRPVQILDQAVVEVARQNYSYRVRVDSGDELGRLAQAFNTMCDSLQSARDELIRQERMATIARLASSIVHDLRNPLAAIYGGAEMLLDDRLADAQKRRLATNIHRASQRIQAMLQDLANVSRGKTQNTELCSLSEVVESAVDSQRALAEAHSVRINVDIPESVELVIERARVERVFLNLIGNALEAMPNGGEISITAKVEETGVVVEVEDTGPGISEEIRGKLFQPFVTFGKRNGLGLGLALARQTILDHGGDMWISSEGTRGARFCLRLPMERRGAAVA